MTDPKLTSPETSPSVPLPANVRVGASSRLLGERTFRRFFSELDPAITIGEHCHIDGVQLALGRNARLSIGDYTYAADMVILAEQEVRIGSHVFIGWNVTIADTDFHPLDPATRLLDALALSPVGQGRPRPPVPVAPVEIGDGVYIGPNAAILKGVTIGAGAFIEPGALVTRSVPPRARVLGNPAQVIEQV